MDSELEKNAQPLSNEQTEGAREGYSRQTESYSPNYRNASRPQRPRIHSQRAYSSEGAGNESEGVQKVSAVRCKTTNVHSAVTNLTKEVITANKGDTTAVVAIVDHNKVVIAHVSTTMVANNKEVTNPAHKVIMHVLNNKAIVLATMRMAKSSKEATNLVNNKVMDAHNKGAINLAADTQTTVTTTTMVAVIPNKVDITIATIIIIMEATITTHNRISTTTATLRTIAQAMTPMRNTA